MDSDLSQHDFVYEVAPEQWKDGIPIANGAIGAVIWGDGQPLHFTLDSYDIWEQRTVWAGDDPRFTYANLRRLFEQGKLEELREVALRRKNMRFIDKPPPMPTRICLGRMELQWKSKPIGFGCRLDLQHAVSEVTIPFKQGRSRVTSFVCSTLPVLVVEIVGKLPTVTLVPAVMDDFSRRNFESWEYPDPVITHERNRCVLCREYSDGKRYSIVTQWKQSKNRMILMLTIENGLLEDDTTARSIQRLDNSMNAGVPSLRKSHELEWSKFWQSSDISLPNSRLENLYYAEQYKHHSLSRPGGLPITLQGLWTSDGAWPPWRGSYTVDMNVQESYWPIYTSNTIASGEPMFEMYFRNLPQFRRIGEYFYGKPIPVITGEHGPGGEPFPGSFSDEHSPGAGAWIAHMFWLRWLYTRDINFLRQRAYPFMREMSQAYLHIAEKRADGKFHIPFQETPEYFCEPETMGDDGSYDLSLSRFLLRALLDAQEFLAEADPDCPRDRDLLDNLLELPADGHHRMLLRPGLPLGRSHRHHSHMIGIYPLGVIDVEDSDEERKRIETSIDHLVLIGTGAWSGWSFPWASMIAGRAGRAAMAHRYLQTYLDCFVLPNTFHSNLDYRHSGVASGAEPIVTLEAGFAAAAAILEMLLQSHGGLIRIFPTVPPTWSNAQFRTLRAEGAFLVSARLANHQVRIVEITSEAGVSCRIRNPSDENGDWTLKDRSTGKTRILRGSELKFGTTRGGHYRLTPVGVRLSKQETAWTPPRRPRAESNWYGLKRHPRF